MPRDPDARPEGAAAPGRGSAGEAPGGDDELDRALDEEFASGKPDALEAAYRRYGATVHGYARRAAGVEAADEVTQDVFLAAWRSSSRYDPARGSLGGWLMGIARHKAVDALRGRERAAARLARVAAEAPAGPEAAGGPTTTGSPSACWWPTPSGACAPRYARWSSWRSTPT